MEMPCLTTCPKFCIRMWWSAGTACRLFNFRYGLTPLDKYGRADGFSFFNLLSEVEQDKVRLMDFSVYI